MPRLETDPSAPPPLHSTQSPGVVDSVLDLIGETPMLRLRRFEPAGRGELFVKVEWLSPGGSIKDRAALGMVDWAEAQGHLEPGGTIIEATAGNTGIGLALVGAQRGYRVILVVPHGYAEEKVRLMQALGATVDRTPKSEGIQGALAHARALAAELPGAYVPMQWENPGNPAIHARTTAEEIWRQLEGRIDAAVIGVGTGGTFSGIARRLKEKDPRIHCVAVETNGSVLQGGEPGPHEVEGIGTSFVPENFDAACADEIVMVHDDDSFATAKRLAAVEGLLVAGSSGANVFAALGVARALGPTSRVVTVLCDSAERYLSKGRLGGPPE